MGSIARVVELMERVDANGVAWKCTAELLEDNGAALHWTVRATPVLDSNTPGQPVMLLLPPEWQPTPFNKSRVGTAVLSLVLPLDQSVVPIESVVQLAGAMSQSVLKDGVASMSRLHDVAMRLEHARVEVMAAIEVLADALAVVLDAPTVAAVFVVTREGLKQRPIAVTLLRKLESMVQERMDMARGMAPGGK